MNVIHDCSITDIVKPNVGIFSENNSRVIEGMSMYIMVYNQRTIPSRRTFPENFPRRNSPDIGS